MDLEGLKARVRDVSRAADDMMTIIRTMEVAAGAASSRGGTTRFEGADGTLWVTVDVAGIVQRMHLSLDDYPEAFDLVEPSPTGVERPLEGGE